MPQNFCISIYTKPYNLTQPLICISIQKSSKFNLGREFLFKNLLNIERRRARKTNFPRSFELITTRRVLYHRFYKVLYLAGTTPYIPRIVLSKSYHTTLKTSRIEYQFLQKAFVLMLKNFSMYSITKHIFFSNLYKKAITFMFPTIYVTFNSPKDQTLMCYISHTSSYISLYNSLQYLICFFIQNSPLVSKGGV